MRARLPKNPVTPAASMRHKLGLTQTKIAGLLGISKNTWIRWEKGKCKPDGEALARFSHQVIRGSIERLE
jgi:DNA-binding transcriptional regulator YiaG